MEFEEAETIKKKKKRNTNYGSQRKARGCANKQRQGESSPDNMGSSLHAMPTTMFAQIYQGYQECYNDTPSPMVLILTTVISKTYRAHCWL